MFTNVENGSFIEEANLCCRVLTFMRMLLMLEGLPASTKSNIMDERSRLRYYNLHVVQRDL